MRACFHLHLQMVVNEEGVHSLLILHAEPSDAGAYTCVARNPAGEAKFSVTLRVTPRSRSEPPRFLEKPVSISVPEGEPASFVCRAAGTPAPAFSWLADGRPLDARAPGGFRVESDQEADRSSLVIERALVAHSGWYQVTVANVAGVISARARLVVIGGVISIPDLT